MRKPRDIDAELKALAEKARGLKAQRLTQMGELVTLTGTDALDLETLAGGLLHVLDKAKVPGTREVIPNSGAAFSSGARGGAKVLAERLGVTRLALRRTTAATRRAEAALAGTDTRSWMTARGGRRQLIELGGLVQEAGLVDLTDSALDRNPNLGSGMASPEGRLAIARVSIVEMEYLRSPENHADRFL